MEQSIASRWSVVRKAVSCAAAAALALSLTPAAAFAAVDASGNVSYTMPTQPVSIEKSKTDAKGNAYTQENLSVMLGTPPMQTPYYRLLGINNAGMPSDREASLSNPSTFLDSGLFGSDANVAPDDYLYNYCVSVTNKSANIPADQMAVFMEDGPNRTSWGKAVAVSINGENFNMPNEVYSEVSLIVADGETASPKAEAAASKTWRDWVKLENQRTSRPKKAEYAPHYIAFSTNSGGTYQLAESIYGIAEIADSIIKGSADANGNYRYATRYAEGPNTASVAADFEDISKGVEYYVLSKVKSNEIQKATVAVVCGYDSSSKAFAVRVLDTGIAGDKDSSAYAGRLASAVNPIATDITTLNLPIAQATYTGNVINPSTGQEATSASTGKPVSQAASADYVKWYTAEQIIQNCDAVFLTDAPSTNFLNPYCACNSKGVVESPFDTPEALTTLTAAQQAAKSAKSAKVADICAKYPKNMFDNYYAQGPENVMLNFIMASYLYPEKFDLTDTMAWWAKNIWHVKDASLQDIIDSTCYGISLSSNQTKVGNYSSNFEQKIDNMIATGNRYYIANQATVDAIAEGNLKTHDLDALKARTPDATEQTIKVTNPGSVEFSKNKTVGLNASAEGALTYSSDNEKVATVDASGKITVKGVGKATITIKAAATDTADAAQTTATINVTRAANKITVKNATKSYTAAAKSKKLSKTQTFTLKGTALSGTKVTYKAASAAGKKITVNKAGKVTVKAGLAKGKYTVKVKASAAKNATYKAVSNQAINVKITIK